MPTIERRLRPSDLRALADLVERGRADGYFEISVDDDGFDPYFDLDYNEIPRFLRRIPERVKIDMQVEPGAFLYDLTVRNTRGSSSAPPPSGRELAQRSRDVVIQEILTRVDGAQPGTTLSSRDWERVCSCTRDDPRACPLHKSLYQEPPPPPDAGPAMDLLNKIVKVIVQAWTMDDTSKRFKLLELD